MLRVLAASKAFLGRRVLKGIELRLDHGRIYAMVGPNGAGKTVLLKVLAGIYGLDDGSLELDGKVYAPLSPADALESGVAYVPQIPYIPADADASELQECIASPTRVPARFGAPRLLSMEERHHFELERALALEPRLLLVDEPRSLRSKSGRALWERIRRECRRIGTTVLLVSHDLEASAPSSDVFLVVRDGRCVATFEANSATRRTSDALQALGAHELPKALDIPWSPPSQPPRMRFRDLSIHSGLTTVFGGASPNWSAVLDTLLRGLVDENPRVLLGVLRGDRSDRDLALGCTLAQNLMMPLLRGVGAWRQLLSPNNRSQATIHEALIRCGVTPSTLNAKAGELSGGNKQRLAYARLALVDADLFVLVSPWRGLDGAGMSTAIALIVDWLKRGSAVCVCTTDAEEADFFSKSGESYTVQADDRIVPGIALQQVSGELP